MGERAWRAKADCKNQSELFFEDRGERPEAREERENMAKLICASCPVLAECGDYAKEKREKFGIWGGKTALERGYASNGDRVPQFRKRKDLQIA